MNKSTDLQSSAKPAPAGQTSWRPPGSDIGFYLGLGILGGSYVIFIVSMLLADAWFIADGRTDFAGVLFSKEISYSIRLSIISCTITMILSLWIAVPIAYLMSRHKFFGKNLIDAILDIPIMLPPLVIGLSLLILFRQTPIKYIDDRFPIAFFVPAVILAQFSVACAFAVRTLRATFDEIPTRHEDVALTLGCSRSQAFWLVVLPEAKRGLLTAATLAWARALGEFGPILIFAGTTTGRTDVLPIAVHSEFAAGRLPEAVVVSLMMVAIALTVLILFRVVVGGSLAPKMN